MRFLPHEVRWLERCAAAAFILAGLVMVVGGWVK
jgi:hypothetical protein